MANIFITDETAYIYFYPTGEKDHALIIIAYEEQMASLEIFPFINLIERKYYEVNPRDGVELEEEQLGRGLEIYEEWFTKK